MAPYRAQIVCFLCLAISGLIFAPGCGMFASKDGVIGQVVETGNSRRLEMVTPEGKFSDYQVYRKPDTDVVVFEYKLKPGLQLDKATAISDQLKAGLVSDLNTADKSVLNSGVHIRGSIHRRQR